MKTTAALFVVVALALWASTGMAAVSPGDTNLAPISESLASTNPNPALAGNYRYVLVDDDGNIVSPGNVHVPFRATNGAFSGSFAGNGDALTNSDDVWIGKGDMHGGFEPGYGDRAIGTNWLANSFDWIAQQSPSVFISWGDMIDAANGSAAGYQFIATQLGKPKAAGAKLVLSRGNHEGYLSTALWDQYIWPLINDGFITSRRHGTSTVEYVKCHTNGAARFAFVVVDFASTNRTLWLKAAAEQHPNHIVVAVTHYWMNSHAGFVNDEDSGGPGLSWRIVQTIPNLGYIFCGHQRDSFDSAYRSDVLQRGNVLQSLFFNTQQHTNVGANLSRRFVFKPKLNAVFVDTYDSEAGAWLTNGQPAQQPSWTSNAYFQSFSFPIFEARGSSPQFLYLQGIPQRMQSDASYVGNWSRTLSTNALPDTALVLGATDNSAWILAREFGSRLQLRYRQPSASGSIAASSILGYWETNGAWHGVTNAEWPGFYFVDPVGGSDAGNGSLAAPWLTLSQAATRATATETVYVLRGGLTNDSVTNLAATLCVPSPSITVAGVQFYTRSQPLRIAGSGTFSNCAVFCSGTNISHQIQCWSWDAPGWNIINLASDQTAAHMYYSNVFEIRASRSIVGKANLANGTKISTKTQIFLAAPTVVFATANTAAGPTDDWTNTVVHVRADTFTLAAPETAGAGWVRFVIHGALFSRGGFTAVATRGGNRPIYQFQNCRIASDADLIAAPHGMGILFNERKNTVILSTNVAHF